MKYCKIAASMATAALLMPAVSMAKNSLPCAANANGRYLSDSKKTQLDVTIDQQNLIINREENSHGLFHRSEETLPLNKLTRAQYNQSRCTKKGNLLHSSTMINLEQSQFIEDMRMAQSLLSDPLKTPGESVDIISMVNSIVALAPSKLLFAYQIHQLFSATNGKLEIVKIQQRLIQKSSFALYTKLIRDAVAYSDIQQNRSSSMLKIKAKWSAELSRIKLLSQIAQPVNVNGEIKNLKVSPGDKNNTKFLAIKTMSKQRYSESINTKISQANLPKAQTRKLK